MKCGRWRMKYRLTFPIRGSGCDSVTHLQSKWDNLQLETLFREIVLEPSSIKSNISIF